MTSWILERRSKNCGLATYAFDPLLCMSFFALHAVECHHSVVFYPKAVIVRCIVVSCFLCRLVEVVDGAYQMFATSCILFVMESV